MLEVCGKDRSAQERVRLKPPLQLFLSFCPGAYLGVVEKEKGMGLSVGAYFSGTPRSRMAARALS